MTLIELQDSAKLADGKPSPFLLLNGRLECSWLDVWLGLFLCPKAGSGFFQVRDFRGEPVEELKA